MDPMAREAIFNMYDFSSDGKLSRMEFVTLCADHLWNTPTEVLDMMVKNLLKAQGARKAANVAYWTAMSEKVESRARVVVPLMYFLTLIVIFNLDMRDDYKDDPKVRARAMVEAMVRVMIGVGVSYHRSR